MAFLLYNVAFGIFLHEAFPCVPPVAAHKRPDGVHEAHMGVPPNAHMSVTVFTLFDGPFQELCVFVRLCCSQKLLNHGNINNFGEVLICLKSFLYTFPLVFMNFEFTCFQWFRTHGAESIYNTFSSGVS